MSFFKRFGEAPDESEESSEVSASESSGDGNIEAEVSGEGAGVLKHVASMLGEKKQKVLETVESIKWYGENPRSALSHPLITRGAIIGSIILIGLLASQFTGYIDHGSIVSALDPNSTDLGGGTLQGHLNVSESGHSLVSNSTENSSLADLNNSQPGAVENNIVGINHPDGIDNGNVTIGNNSEGHLRGVYENNGGDSIPVAPDTITPEGGSNPPYFPGDHHIDVPKPEVELENSTLVQPNNETINPPVERTTPEVVTPVPTESVNIDDKIAGMQSGYVRPEYVHPNAHGSIEEQITGISGSGGADIKQKIADMQSVTESNYGDIKDKIAVMQGNGGEDIKQQIANMQSSNSKGLEGGANSGGEIASGTKEYIQDKIAKANADKSIKGA